MYGRFGICRGFIAERIGLMSSNGNESVLLIIGNGFDLQCGLKSEYKDFFKWLRPKNTENDKRVYNNVWATHFLDNFLNKSTGVDGWIDIENILKNTLLVGRRIYYEDQSHYGSLVEAWRGDAFYHLENGRKPRVNSNESRRIARHVRLNGDESFRKHHNYLYWFLDRLIDFESFFVDYLSEQFENNPHYISNVFKLIKLIVGGEDFSVINFNYTNPFGPAYLSSASQELKDSFKSTTNVHGTLSDNNIIFGIDATNENELPPEARIFTKTHRKMLLKSPNSALPTNITKIKFYGHSLGEADYSYFQSIFDNYNLYGDDYDTLNYYSNNKQVILQFYFTVLDIKNRKSEQRSAVDRVYKLITGYGATLDNKDKGKNLLHKLLLEGRVQIKFLPKL
ncbi:MAG: bacteriophage abortive infection AbiH family protein [Defluviitaleaceae bacterium]|nr:bacteriophage abortive infection AbiH family protein [Defluviitaleaceae bacterium]